MMFLFLFPSPLLVLFLLPGEEKSTSIIIPVLVTSDPPEQMGITGVGHFFFFLLSSTLPFSQTAFFLSRSNGWLHPDARTVR